MLTILAVLMVLGVAFRAMTPDGRARLVRAVPASIRHLKHVATHRGPECERFRDALRARTPWAPATPALVALNATIFVFMLFGSRPLGNPETLVGWGGNFGPRTANGEWWRLLTSMFVHAGMFHLLVNVASLVQVGLILERLVGRLAFAAVYVSAGVFAGLVSLSTRPLAVSVGASGAIFGLYGLLLASSIWSMVHRSSATIPLAAVKRLCPAAAVFILYNVANDSLAGPAELAGLVAGLVCGLVLARGVSERKPSTRWVAAAMTATIVIAVRCAIPLRGITDVRPEIERVIAVEDRTANAYRTAVDRFRDGRLTAEALAQLIDRTIMPELQATQARLKALSGVPQEQQPLVADAEEYFRLRDESWRLRTEGLRKASSVPLREAPSTERRLRAEAQHQANLRALGTAEATERASLEALQRIKPAAQK